MDSDKLLIGGIVVIALIIAIPVLAPMFTSERAYDPIVDSHKLEALKNAVNTYGQETGQYPASLFDLVPKYIEEIPLTSTNLQFGYDPRNGAIINPSAPAGAQAAVKNDGGKRERRPGSGTLSPASEAMTGLGISEELNY